MIHYYELEPENNRFKTILIQTTYKCQMKCSNCYLGDMLNNESIPDVDYDKLADVLDRLPNRCDIRFLGAEPTMNTQLTSLIRLVREKHHRPSMLTNGLKLSRESYVNELKQAGINTLGLSMNGGLDNDVYKIYDNGRYAKQKTQALENCFKYKILPHVNIIVSPLNLHVIRPLIDYIVEMAIKYDINFNKFPVMIRPKSIGQLGNYLNTTSYSLSQLTEIMSVATNTSVSYINENNMVDGFEENHTKVFRFQTLAGDMLCKMTDWNLDENGIIDGGSLRRGILTDSYKIAPAFEYYDIQVNK